MKHGSFIFRELEKVRWELDEVRLESESFLNANHFDSDFEFKLRWTFAVVQLEFDRSPIGLRDRKNTQKNLLDSVKRLKSPLDLNLIETLAK